MLANAKHIANDWTIICGHPKVFLVGLIVLYDHVDGSLRVGKDDGIL